MGATGAPTVLCWHGAGESSLDFEPVAVELAERLDVPVVAIDAPGDPERALALALIEGGHFRLPSSGGWLAYLPLAG